MGTSCGECLEAVSAAEGGRHCGGCGRFLCASCGGPSGYCASCGFGSRAAPDVADSLAAHARLVRSLRAALKAKARALETLSAAVLGLALVAGEEPTPPSSAGPAAAGAAAAGPPPGDDDDVAAAARLAARCKAGAQRLTERAAKADATANRWRDRYAAAEKTARAQDAELGRLRAQLQDFTVDRHLRGQLARMQQRLEETERHLMEQAQSRLQEVTAATSSGSAGTRSSAAYRFRSLSAAAAAIRQKSSSSASSPSTAVSWRDAFSTRGSCDLSYLDPDHVTVLAGGAEAAPAGGGGCWAWLRGACASCASCMCFWQKPAGEEATAALATAEGSGTGAAVVMMMSPRSYV